MDCIKNLLLQIKELLYDLVNYIKENTSEKESEVLENKKVRIKKETVYVDIDRLILVKKDKNILLTLNEAILVREFLKEKENLCTYESLCKSLYGYELDEYAIKGIRNIVYRLKKKVNGILKIKTIRNRGFIAYEVDSNE